MSLDAPYAASLVSRVRYEDVSDELGPFACAPLAPEGFRWTKPELRSLSARQHAVPAAFAGEGGRSCRFLSRRVDFR